MAEIAVIHGAAQSSKPQTAPSPDRTTENFVPSQTLAGPRGSNGIAGFTLEARRPGS